MHEIHEFIREKLKRRTVSESPEPVWERVLRSGAIELQNWEGPPLFSDFVDRILLVRLRVSAPLYLEVTSQMEACGHFFMGLLANCNFSLLPRGVLVGLLVVHPEEQEEAESIAFPNWGSGNGHRLGAAVWKPVAPCRCILFSTTKAEPACGTLRSDLRSYLLPAGATLKIGPRPWTPRDLVNLSKEGNVFVSVSMTEEAVAPLACPDDSLRDSHLFVHFCLAEESQSPGAYEGTFECDGVVKILQRHEKERTILKMMRNKRILGEQLDQHFIASFATARNWTRCTGQFQRLCQFLRPNADKLRMIAASASINPFSRSSVMLRQNGGYVQDFLNKHSGQGFQRIRGVYDTKDPEFPGGSIAFRRS